MALALLALFVALGGGAWAVVSVSPGIERATTLRFSADGERHDLFRIGGSTVWTRCTQVEEPGPEEGGISRSMFVAAGPKGAIVVTDGHGEQFFERIAPNDSEPIMLDAIPPGGPKPNMRSFTVFDGGGRAASGTAALLAKPSQDRCVATAQVAG